MKLKCKCLLILQDPNANIGQRAGFSERDLQKLAIMYQNV
jgi:hypothetical protein